MNQNVHEFFESMQSNASLVLFLNVSNIFVDNFLLKFMICDLNINPHPNLNYSQNIEPEVQLETGRPISSELC